MVSSLSRHEHAVAVASVIEHLRAGDCYQVNLTRRLSTRRRADPRALFAALLDRNPAPHAALVELDGVTLVSASPERFLRVDNGGVETRPIKGTHASAERLMASSKDLAEHVMIVDMARNDLGRVCDLGSVRVAELVALEHHPGLAHLVSTVRGRLRDTASLGDVVRATFPPASITGAPKPRVMQIIDALEPVRRGYYCGAIGWIDSAAARADLAVGIRTFVVSEHGTDLGVGGGIVADSTAAGEWHESCLKAARLLDAAGAYETSGEMIGASR
jgi:para-aminobenzoate synthetase component 1